RHDNNRAGPSADDPLFNLFVKTDGFWWPYRSLARALLATQKNAGAYVEANRLLIDEMRDIVRREEDLALEIFQKAIEAAESGAAANGQAMLDTAEINAMFERAILALRELCEAWMNTQMRVLDAMRLHASGAHDASSKGRSEGSMAAE